MQNFEHVIEKNEFKIMETQTIFKSSINITHQFLTLINLLF